MSNGATGAAGWMGRGIAFLVLCVVFFRAAQTYADSDIWGHVRFGLDMLESGEFLPRVDPYSYLTSGHDWIDNEWLADLLAGFLFQEFGTPGLTVMKAGLALLATALLYAHLCRAGFNSLWGGLLLLPGSYLILLCFTGVLMMMFTLLFFVMLMLLLDAAEKNRQYLWALPPLFAVWVNLHPGVLAGVGCAGVWIIAHLVDETLKKGPWATLFRAPGGAYWLTGVGILLATLVNPYGIDLPMLIMRDGFAHRPEINQFTPIRITSLEGAAYLVLLGLSVAAWLFTSLPRNVPLLVVFIATALTPLIAVRHAPLFAASALVLAGPHLANLWQRWQQKRAPSAAPSAGIAVAPFFGGVVLIALTAPHLGRINIEPAATAYPVRAVAILKDSGVHGRLVVFFDWGEYVLWQVGPGVQVSLDPRRHSAYSHDVFIKNFAFQNGVGAWDTLLTDGPADMVLTTKKFPAFNLMRCKTDWTMVYEDELCGLFVRADSPLRAPLTATPVRADLPVDGAGMTFP